MSIWFYPWFGAEDDLIIGIDEDEEHQPLLGKKSRGFVGETKIGIEFRYSNSAKSIVCCSKVAELSLLENSKDGRTFLSDVQVKLLPKDCKIKKNEEKMHFL